MAIYLDDKMLKADPKAKEGSLEREYAVGLSKVEELFNKFRIKGSKNSYIQISRDFEGDRQISMTTHRVKKLPPIALPVEVPWYNDELGATLIRYSPSPPTRNSEGKLTWTVKYIEFNEALTITDRQKDLAWFLLIASNLVRRGVYKMVDNEAKYEGSFQEILTKKKVVDAITGNNEELVRALSRMFMGEYTENIEFKELVVTLHNALERDKKWTEAFNEVEKLENVKVLKKEKVSEVEYDGKKVPMLVCPEEIKYIELKVRASNCNIKLTSPPQTKDMLYSLIRHIEEQKQMVLNE